LKESTSFLKEAQILKELNHKNIVKYYDVLRKSDGIYIFLEYVFKVKAFILIMVNGLNKIFSHYLREVYGK